MVEYYLPKFCPRCRGKMIQETDWFGTYASCLTCGHVHESTTAFPMELLMEEANKKKGKVGGARRHGKIKL